MILRSLHRLLVVVAVLACSASLHAADTFTHQGRLLDASGSPLPDGFYGATFSLWDDPVAGTQVWSELHDVQTKDGLFSVELGSVDSFFDIFTEVSLYLQVQVQVGGATETLSPRLSLGSAPYAFTAKRVHGIHHGNSEVSRCLMAATDSGAVIYLDDDSDDDGISDVSSSIQTSPTGVRHTLVWSPSSNVARHKASVTCGDIKCSMALAVDLDGDGLADRRLDEDCDDDDASISLACSPPGSGGGGGGAVHVQATEVSSSVAVSGDFDDDTIPEQEIDQSVTPTTSSVAIKTKGTGADANRVVSVISSTDPTGASSACALDLDGDGLPERSVLSGCDDTGAKHAINTKGTGGNKLGVACTTTESSASFYLDSDDDGDGISESFSLQLSTADSVVNEVSYEFTNSLLMPALMKAKEKANKTKCSNSLRQQSPISVTETEASCDSVDARTTWSADDFGGAISFVTIQASVNGALNPIEHSSGAALTPGGVWSNASDVNLKENFRAVDGEEILDKIDQLEISQWNYKNESDEVTHIGPTAQDFKAAFGVGDNDRSISTIDPAGIALVAVKELRKENLELKAQIAELKTMVEKLASNK